MSNVLNYFEQPIGIDNVDNKLVLNGTVSFNGEEFSGEKLANVLANNDYLVVSANGALLTNGFNVVNGGTGLASLTLGAPRPGVKCNVILASITSGSVVVTLPSGVTFDGTNNTATFDTVNDKLVLVYNTNTQWQVVYNSGVVLSLV